MKDLGTAGVDYPHKPGPRVPAVEDSPPPPPGSPARSLQGEPWRQRPPPAPGSDSTRQGGPGGSHRTASAPQSGGHARPGLGQTAVLPGAPRPCVQPGPESLSGQLPARSLELPVAHVPVSAYPHHHYEESFHLAISFSLSLGALGLHGHAGPSLISGRGRSPVVSCRFLTTVPSLALDLHSSGAWA